VSYNILHNGFFEEGQREHFDRIIPALDPDILAVQEAWGDQESIAALMTEWIPGTWHVSSEWDGNYVISRFPILHEAVLISSGRSMAVLLDTEAELDKNILIINSHFSCCSSNDDRQQQVDELIGVMREWMKEEDWTGPFYLEMETPFFHVGDFNLVGYRQQLVTLTEGDIVDEDSYGDDFLPDWDESFITDLFSHNTGIRMGYTWRSDGSSFSPGKLDYILYSDSNLEIAKHFVLNTMALSEEELEQYGLEEWDVYHASDHMPRVADILALNVTPDVEEEGSLPEEFRLYPAYPNPFNATTRISYTIPQETEVCITIYDIQGREVEILVSDKVVRGENKVIWDASDYSSGIYFCHMAAGIKQFFRKLILLK
jgi:endonuclease/exonuclease/phosphatase family metal-dependent hydrolase